MHPGGQQCNHSWYSLYFDGGSRGNPGLSGCGAILYNESQDCIWSGGKYLGSQTNNVAEYNGLIMGLEAAADLGTAALEIRGDSRLVINQV
jgi:ribonuclease HI